MSEGQEGARVMAHRPIARDHDLLSLWCPPIARAAQPGQFVHVRIGREGRARVRGVPSFPSCPSFAPFPLLRRPFSLFDAAPARGTFDLIYKVVGLGTSALREVAVGESLDVLGPLGTAFTADGAMRRAILIGGGVGVPPLYFLAKHLVQGEGSRVKVDVFLGARTQGWVICAEAFRRLGLEVHAATDDGTVGFRGSVVALAEKVLRDTRYASRDTALYICGPTPMMAAAAELARRWHLPAQVSLEERMGCAMGVCMGCIVEIAGPHATAHKRFQRVCTEGPVFPAETVVWRAHG